MPYGRLLQVKVIQGSDLDTFQSNLQAWLEERGEQQIVDMEFRVGPDGTLYERIYFTEG